MCVCALSLQWSYTLVGGSVAEELVDGRTALARLSPTAAAFSVCVCVCVCVCVLCAYECVCVCVCEWTD